MFIKTNGTNDIFEMMAQEITKENLISIYCFMIKKVDTYGGSYKATLERTYKNYIMRDASMKFDEFEELLNRLIESGLVEVKKDGDMNIYTVNRNIEHPFTDDNFI